ncbi:MAG: histidine kinase [Candidatus Latescibacteria bacterium]|jgi:two-component system, LytTR family, sensor kinase|nr:histidine kinase [Candidatus Latescibacterota bacterium]
MISSGILLSADQFILVTLLVKIGVMTSLATILVRYTFFRRILLAEERGRREDWQFASLFGSLVAIGVVCRLLLGYAGADITLAGTLLIGLLTGPLIGFVTGSALGIIPALSGEVLAVPMGALFGLAGGLVSITCPTRDAVWNFSPITLMNVYRFLKSSIVTSRPRWQVALVFACVVMEILRVTVSQRFASEGWLFSLTPEGPLVYFGVFVSTVACLGIPLKIWNSTRIEAMLEKQAALVTRARFDALQSQINPHFLFNTLNSIAATVRTDPRKARQIVQKLSTILRRLLSTEEDLVTLRDELAFIDSYLDIELVRFGKDKLRINRHIDPDTLDVLIPNMVLQPIVENAIKHGLSSKVDGGSIAISSRLVENAVVIEVADDGVGVPAVKLNSVMTAGIGLSNVNERLMVIFGSQFDLDFHSQPDAGTRVTIKIPDRAPLDLVAKEEREEQDVHSYGDR